MRWIRSNGGPLLCIEQDLAQFWGGIGPLHIEWRPGGTTDYDRACRSNRYAAPVEVSGEMGVVLNAGPLNTTLWTDRSGHTVIVQIEYAEPDTDFPAFLASLPPAAFANPVERCAVTFKTADVVIFDSAYPGSDSDLETISFRINPGAYELRTFVGSDQKTGWVLSQFVPARRN